jgi:hypothetical protein
MESARFDVLVRRLAGAATRRTVLTGLTAALTRLVPDAASAEPRPACRGSGCRCPKGKRRCGTRCISRQSCCRDGECGACERCRKGRCRSRCHSSQVCQGGNCKCASGSKPCDGGCIPQAACCGGCGPAQVCVAGTCVAAVCGNGGPCVVFVSNDQFKANQIGGLSGADSRCQEQAGQPLCLVPTGVYKAWLSYNADSPQTRFTHSPGPYVLVDGTRVANSFADLIDDEILQPIIKNQFGDFLGGSVWTNTTTTGLAIEQGDTGSCGGWVDPLQLGEVGLSQQFTSSWTDSGTTQECNEGWLLYCFQQS